MEEDFVTRRVGEFDCIINDDFNNGIVCRSNIDLFNSYCAGLPILHINSSRYNSTTIFYSNHPTFIRLSKTPVLDLEVQDAINVF